MEKRNSDLFFDLVMENGITIQELARYTSFLVQDFYDSVIENNESKEKALQVRALLKHVEKLLNEIEAVKRK